MVWGLLLTGAKGEESDPIYYHSTATRLPTNYCPLMVPTPGRCIAPPSTTDNFRVTTRCALREQKLRIQSQRLGLLSHQVMERVSGKTPRHLDHASTKDGVRRGREYPVLGFNIDNGCLYQTKQVRCCHRTRVLHTCM